MNKSGFWSDASRYGAIIGAVEILFMLLDRAVAGNSLLALLVSAANIVVFVWLLFRFTKQRSLLSDEGFGYGQSLGYILAMSLFAGVLVGGYEIVARNWLFTETYQELVKEQLVLMQKMAAQNPALSLSELKSTLQEVTFSPIWVVVGSVFGMLIKALFFGLFVSFATRREESIFESSDQE